MNYEIPEKMKAWVLGNPGELTLEEKPVPEIKIGTTIQIIE